MSTQSANSSVPTIKGTPRHRSEWLAAAFEEGHSFVRTQDGRILLWSAGAERIYGYSKQEAVGRISHELLRTEFPEDLNHIHSRLLQHSRWTGELRRQTRDGRQLVVASDWVLRTDGGSPPIVVESSTDITELKHVLEERERLALALGEQAAELDAVLASMPDALYIGDSSGIRRVNRMGLAQLGFSSEEELRKKVGDLARRIQTRDYRSGEILTTEEQPFSRALKGEAVTQDVATRHLVTGEEVVVRCAARPIVHNDRIIGAVAINTDVTAERRAAAEREELVRALERSNEELERYAHVVSHDLQTPIRAIRAFTELLERRYRSRLDEAGEELVTSIVDAAASMEELIRALLQYAQVGQDTLNEEKVNVSVVVESVLKTLEPYLEEVDGEVHCGPLPAVRADGMQLHQLFQNLIGNALKYRKPDVRPVVEVGAEKRGDSWCFSVRDNGIGIPAGEADRIFAPFKRLHGQNVPGNGIGLAVCRKIVERHGGRIWVESEEDKGSCFYFLIPI